MPEVVVSEMDNAHLSLIRRNIDDFLAEGSSKYDRRGALVLDIAPQVHKGAAHFFKESSVETLDIDPDSRATYIADITRQNDEIPGERFDLVVCTEVLEHTLDPFAAVEEIGRLLKPGGILLLTTPFNFRIHGPLPDCWRFTEHGLRALLGGFEILDLREVPTEGRALMPLQYLVIAGKS